MIVDEGVKIVETAGSNPAPHLPMFHDNGIKVSAQVHPRCGTASRRRAWVWTASASMVSNVRRSSPVRTIHPGLVLIPAAADKIEIPLIASGGFADARGLGAALALGADGINMGSRFMCTVESCIHQNVKEAIVAGDELAPS